MTTLLFKILSIFILLRPLKKKIKNLEFAYCFLAEFWFCLPYSNNPFLIQNHHTIEFLFMQAFSYKNKETGTQVYLENNQIRDAPLRSSFFSKSGFPHRFISFGCF